MRLRMFGIPLVFLLATLLLTGCNRNNSRPATTDSPVQVNVAQLQAGNLSNEIGADGKVKSSKTATITSSSSGRVVSIAAKVGDEVEAGQALIWVEDPLAPSNIRRLQAQLEGSQAQMESARLNTSQAARQKQADVEQAMANVKLAEIGVQKSQSQLQSAQTELTRKQDLLTKKAIAQTDVEKARLTRDQAQSDLNSAKVQLLSEKEKLAATQANLAVALQQTQESEAAARVRQSQADLDSALAQKSQDVVRSPMTGRVAESNVQIGQDPATSSAPLMVIVDDREPTIEASFDEQYSDRLVPGLRAEGYPVSNPDKKLTLTVERVTPESKQSLVSVELRIIEKPDFRLTSDSYVRVRLSLGNQDGITVPVAAVIWNQNGDPSVMVAEGRIARLKPIKILDQNESTVLVSKESLKVGELLIVEGQTGLADGSAITYKNE